MSLQRPNFVDGLFSSEKADTIEVESRRAQEKLEKIKDRERERVFHKEQERRYDLVLREPDREEFFPQQPKARLSRQRVRIKLPQIKLDRFTAIRIGLALVSVFILFAGISSLATQSAQLPGQVKGISSQSQRHLTRARQAAKEFDIVKATKEFREASRELGQANQILERKGQFSQYWSQLPYNKNPEFSLVNLLSLADQNLQGLESLFTLFARVAEEGDFSPQKQRQIEYLLSRTESNLGRFNRRLAGLQNSQYFFPSQIEEYRQDLGNLKEQIGMARELIAYAPDFLGYQEEKRYLLLFQNNVEIRPTGGFIGTFGYLTVKDGKSQDLYVDQIYGPKYLQRQDLAQIEKSALGYPENIPARLIPAESVLEKYRYAFYAQNTNCTPDFPISAERALWSFENVLKQPPADRVIALDPGVAIDILKIIGPVPMPQYKVILNANNFRKVIQRKVDVDNPFKRGEDKSYNPKQILVDFTPKFLSRINQASVEQKFQIFFLLYQNLIDKHILLYARDPRLEELIQRHRFGGAIVDYPGDYLSVNLDITGGNNKKAGFRIVKEYWLTSRLQPGRQVNHQLRINLRKRGGKRKTKLWIRAMVPYGSRLVKASWNNQTVTGQIDQLTEASKQVFLFKTRLVGQRRGELILNYQSTTIFKPESGYQLYLQSQPGITNARLKSDISWLKSSPTNYRPDKMKLAKNHLIYQAKFNRDQEFNIEF